MFHTDYLSKDGSCTLTDLGRNDNKRNNIFHWCQQLHIFLYWNSFHCSPYHLGMYRWNFLKNRHFLTFYSSVNVLIAWHFLVTLSIFIIFYQIAYLTVQILLHNWKLIIGYIGYSWQSDILHIYFCKWILQWLTERLFHLKELLPNQINILCH